MAGDLSIEAVPLPPESAVPAIPGAGTPAARKPAGQWAVRVQYDPDKGCRAEDFTVPVDQYLKRFQMREKFVGEDGKSITAAPPTVDAVLQVPVKESRRWKPVVLRDQPIQTVKDFWESRDGQHKRFTESNGDFDFDGTGGFSSSSANPTGLIDQEFVPILSGPFYKQMYFYDYLQMHARAFNLVNHNALAQSAVKIMTRFVLGRGLSFHIKHPKAKGVWDEFWERNLMDDRLGVMARDLTWQGELLLKYLEPRSGYLTLRSMDASTCWEVVTDPEDIEHVYYYHFQWPTPYQIWVSGTIPVSKYIIQQVPPTNLQHVKINISSMEKRGRSELLPAMSWLKRFDDFYNGTVLKAVLEANLVWKVKVKGDQADVDAFMTNPDLTILPPPGGTWIENESVDLSAESAQMTASRGAMGVGQQVASIFATSMNLPSEYFNVEGTSAARATALVRTDPVVKAIEDRQQLFRRVLQEMYLRQMTVALMAGRIPKEAAREEPDLQDQPFEANARRRLTSLGV